MRGWLVIAVLMFVAMFGWAPSHAQPCHAGSHPQATTIAGSGLPAGTEMFTPAAVAHDHGAMAEHQHDAAAGSSCCHVAGTFAADISPAFEVRLAPGRLEGLVRNEAAPHGAHYELLRPPRQI